MVENGIDLSNQAASKDRSDMSPTSAIKSAMGGGADDMSKGEMMQII